MRYKTLITDKLISVQNGLKQLRGQMERGERSEFRIKEEQIQEKIEEILTLLNPQEETYN
jgi:hypothetical protein